MKVYRQIAHKQTSKKEGRTPVKRVCRRCGAEIKNGEVYYWFKHRHQGKTYFCRLHRPEAKDMTTSDKLATLYETQDQISDAISSVESVDVDDISSWMGEDEPEEPEIDESDDGESAEAHDKWDTDLIAWNEQKEEYITQAAELSSNLNDLVSALNDAAESAREVAEGYHESANNMEEGFGHETSTSTEIRDKGDQVESWADELEQAASAIEDLSGEIDSDDPINGRQLSDIQSEAVGEAENARDSLSL